jgi:glutathione S-transferase
VRALVLHHYANSPFSEKVRLALGLKRLAWRSVTVPAVLPKPDAVALTGGYRRTPFLQIGADVHCDSAQICRVLERLQPTPTLWPEGVEGLGDTVAQWADQSLFWAAVPFTLQPAGLPHVFAGLSPDGIRAFGADRAAMNPAFRRPPLHDQRAAVTAYLGRLEAMLGDGRPFLLGAVPSIADLSAVQSVWFVRLAPPVAAAIAGFVRVGAWADRVLAIGHGTSEPLASADALAMAREAGDAGAFAPVRVEPEPGLAEGDAVTVTPADYAHDAVAGRLVGLDGTSSVLERTDPRAGTVRVHFPRLGYHLQPAPASTPA